MGVFLGVFLAFLAGFRLTEILRYHEMRRNGVDGGGNSIETCCARVALCLVPI